MLFKKADLLILKGGVISLLYKSGRREDLSNWRPITLLNIDYKIVANVIANRVKNVIGDIINPDQKGYINGRFSGENIRLVEDVLEYTDMFNKNGVLVFLDFAKAFDTVNRVFLMKSLLRFGFGNDLIKW